jgi:hypothetical protein
MSGKGQAEAARLTGRRGRGKVQNPKAKIQGNSKSETPSHLVGSQRNWCWYFPATSGLESPRNGRQECQRYGHLVVSCFRPLPIRKPPNEVMICSFMADLTVETHRLQVNEQNKSSHKCIYRSPGEKGNRWPVGWVMRGRWSDGWSVKAVEGNRTPGRFARLGGGRRARRVPECVQSSGAIGSRPPARAVGPNFHQQTRLPG